MEGLLLHLAGELQLFYLEDHIAHLHGLEQALGELAHVGVVALQPFLDLLQAALVAAVGDRLLYRLVAAKRWISGMVLSLDWF